MKELWKRIRYACMVLRQGLPSVTLGDGTIAKDCIFDGVRPKGKGVVVIGCLIDGRGIL